MSGFAFPIIDLAPWFSGDEVGRRQVADRVRAACETIGFFAVVGHRVPAATIEAMRSTSRAFFDLPLAQKMKVARPRPEQNRAYHAEGTETLARLAGKETLADYKELFAIGPPDVPADDPWFHRLPGAYPNYAANLWPDQPAAFEAAWRAYWTAMEDLQATICHIFANALDLPETWFDRALTRHCSMLRALNYPAQKAPPGPGQLRAGEHTDLGMLTLLKNEAADGGLEVRDLEGNWHEAPTVEDGFIVNIGDLLMRWTNDRFRSTLHRVANPRQGGGARRLSIAYFVAPAYDTIVECLPTCQSSTDRAKYPPVSVAAYRNERFARTAAPNPPAA
ncbi:MAG: isopenicillin N synthase family oxygenase [Proteobacteria bacterium]|nr:isopenicillin N synthase family oxygenase [Pseudomonadota bacterium]